MKVKCISNTSQEQKDIESEDKKDYQFNIKIGSEYTVYGMIFWGDSLDYLIMEESSKEPSWYPVELFEVINHMLPPIWFFNFKKYKNYKNQDSQIALWGYKEMISDPDHYIALTEEKPEALEIFFKRKEQIDEQEEIYQFKTK